tara:strand:+ start:2180 stop:2827 length:648 start_codon:yes stop_codon:yes gene_type:complete
MLRTGLIAKKLGNSSFFTDEGKSTNVTLLKIEDCVVSNVKTMEKHGYNALQLACFDTNKDINKLKKPQRKNFTKLNIKPKKILKEFRVDNENILDVGTTLTVNHFKKDQFVDVIGTSIGKGFAGVMKRHNFAGLRASHGVSISHRSHGSTGQNQDPGRVFKGKKMAGRMGSKRVTKQNLKIIEVDETNKLIVVKGSVPGNKNATVFLKDSIKKNK